MALSKKKFPCECCYYYDEIPTEKLPNKHNDITHKTIKCGIILTCNEECLIVKSRGDMWGLPKGGKLQSETIQHCAVREFKEETGINLDFNLNTHIKIYCTKKSGINCCYNLFKEKIFKKIEPDVARIQQTIHNDVKGIGWIKIRCLKKLKQENKLLTYHLRQTIDLL